MLLQRIGRQGVVKSIGKISVKLVLLAFATGLPAAVRASGPAPIAGVWEGTLGTQKIRTCFDERSWGTFGAYFYLKHLRAIPLGQPDGASRIFVEGHNETDAKAPRWAINAVARGKLSGHWQQGTKRLPIALSKMPAKLEDEESPCGSMAFQGARFQQARTTSVRGTKDGVPITKWTFDPGRPFENVAISTFTLDLPGAAAGSINAKLRSVLPHSSDEADWQDCILGNAGSFGSDGEYDEAIEPLLITSGWLSVRHHGGYYCGGAHPENFSNLRTFDLVSGREVDPLDWLLPRAVKREDLGGGNGVYKTLTSEFVQMILKGWKAGGDAQDEECREATLTQDSWNAGIARGRLVFSPNFPRVIMACGDDYEVPIEELQPWLNDRGKAIVGTLPR